MHKRFRRKLTNILLYTIIIIILFVFNFPIISSVLTSLKTNTDISSSPPKWIFKPILTHYTNVLYAYGYNFKNFFLNSIIISLYFTRSLQYCSIQTFRRESTSNGFEFKTSSNTCFCDTYIYFV